MQVTPPRPVQPTPPLRPTSVDALEAAFLEQMLAYAAPTPAGEGQQGGAQFQSFLTQARAEAMAGRLDLKLVTECIQ